MNDFQFLYPQTDKESRHTPITNANRQSAQSSPCFQTPNGTKMLHPFVNNLFTHKYNNQVNNKMFEEREGTPSNANLLSPDLVGLLFPKEINPSLGQLQRNEMLYKKYRGYFDNKSSRLLNDENIAPSPDNDSGVGSSIHTTLSNMSENRSVLSSFQSIPSTPPSGFKWNKQEYRSHEDSMSLDTSEDEAEEEYHYHKNTESTQIYDNNCRLADNIFMRRHSAIGAPNGNNNSGTSNYVYKTRPIRSFHDNSSITSMMEISDLSDLEFGVYNQQDHNLRESPTQSASFYKNVNSHFGKSSPYYRSSPKSRFLSKVDVNASPILFSDKLSQETQQSNVKSIHGIIGDLGDSIIYSTERMSKNEIICDLGDSYIIKNDTKHPKGIMCDLGDSFIIQSDTKHSKGMICDLGDSFIIQNDKKHPKGMICDLGDSFIIQNTGNHTKKMICDLGDSYIIKNDTKSPKDMVCNLEDSFIIPNDGKHSKGMICDIGDSFIIQSDSKYPKGMMCDLGDSFIIQNSGNHTKGMICDLGDSFIIQSDSKYPNGMMCDLGDSYIIQNDKKHPKGMMCDLGDSFIIQNNGNHTKGMMCDLGDSFIIQSDSKYPKGMMCDLGDSYIIQSDSKYPNGKMCDLGDSYIISMEKKDQNNMLDLGDSFTILNDRNDQKDIMCDLGDSFIIQHNVGISPFTSNYIFDADSIKNLSPIKFE